MQTNEQAVEATPQPILDAPAEGQAPAEPSVETPAEQPQEPPKEEPQQEQEGSAADWYQQDAKAFDEAFPDVDKKTLFGKEDFVDFAEGKVGVMPMTEIYRRYLKWKGQPSRRELARQASPGALGQAQPPHEAEFYTLNEIRKLTPDDIDRNWDKVQRSLKRLSQ